jgi:serine phosphatase RsbU (regulator of sigma subunit)
LLLKDRCLGVFYLEPRPRPSPRPVEILTLLASQAALAIEYVLRRFSETAATRAGDSIRTTQAALLPTELPKRLKGVGVAARFAPARASVETTTFWRLSPTVVIAVGDVPGKGVPAALSASRADSSILTQVTFSRRSDSPLPACWRRSTPFCRA